MTDALWDRCWKLCLTLQPSEAFTRIEKPGRHVGWLTLVLVNLEAVKGQGHTLQKPQHCGGLFLVTSSKVGPN